MWYITDMRCHTITETRHFQTMHCVTFNQLSFKIQPACSPINIGSLVQVSVKFHIDITCFNIILGWVGILWHSLSQGYGAEAFIQLVGLLAQLGTCSSMLGTGISQIQHFLLHILKGQRKLHSHIILSNIDKLNIKYTVHFEQNKSDIYVKYSPEYPKGPFSDLY